MISLEKQIELLTDLSINYQYRLSEQDEEWYNFFKRNDMAIPFCTLYYLKMVNYSIDPNRRAEMQLMVRKTFYELCEVLNIDRKSNHLSIDDMFRRSPNPTIAEWDEEAKKEIERLQNEGVILPQDTPEKV